jgi:hypothetical protein
MSKKNTSRSNNLNLDNKNIEFTKKLTYLQNIRHEIKKKRILLDESKERFGLDELSQLIKVKNTSEVKGYPFKGSKSSYNKITHGINFGLKIVPIETKYDKIDHPCNLENLILKELTDNIINKNISPHFTYYLGTQKVTNKSRSLKMLNLKRLEVENKIRTHSNMLISEFVEGGSLDNWVFNTYENDKEISDDQWCILVFQLIYTISIIQHYYKMMHNDFHYGNILIDNAIEPGGHLVYEINNKTYYINNTGIIPKLFDFEFGMSYCNKIKDCYPNKFIIGPYEYDKKLHKTIIDEEQIKKQKEIKRLEHLNKTDSVTSESDSSDSDEFNVPYNYNEVYDVHYFLTSLLDLYISQELFDWIISLYPRELIPEDDTSSYTSDNTSDTSDTSYTSDTSDTSDTDDTDDTSSTSTNEIHNKQKSINSSNDGVQSEFYLQKGRLLNGTEKKFNLPSPIDLLNNKFFEKFTIKPDNFNESKAIYFKAGF